MRHLLFLLFLLCIRPALAQVTLVEAFPNLPAFTRPVDLQHAGDGSGRLYVVEKQGLILAFDNDPLVAEADTFLDIRSSVSAPEPTEDGLLGLAFHPQYGENGHFFVYYNAPEPDRTVVARFTRAQDEPLRADPESRLILWEVIKPGYGHNGGQLAFGPDGYLYVAVGDGGCCGDEDLRGQDRTIPHGSLLRIDVDRTDGDRNYGIPPDNPFVGNDESFLEEIYAYGLRNPWRFSFDAETGDLWLADVGEGSWEEINLIRPGGNYGWSVKEGDWCFNPAEECDDTGLELPVWMYVHGEGFSVTGGFVYRGQRVSALVGKYVYADFVNGRVWALTYDPDGATDSTSAVLNEELLDTDLRISSFGVDEDGELYVVSYGEEGRLYTFQAAPDLSSEPLPEIGMRLTTLGPNPFRGTTGFAFSIDRTAAVRLAVYDLLGREVAVLFDGVVPAGASRQVSFDAAALASGLYLCRMEVAGRVQTQKVILAR